MILNAIVARKRRELEAARARVPENALRQRAAAMPPPADFAAALERGVGPSGLAAIAEFKRRSPSAGPIRPGADPADVARSYRAGGAAVLSVLTDGPAFGGAPEDLERARSAVGLPVLRKDFILDPYQVWESRALGADAVLLIARCLDPETLRDLAALSLSLGMAPLVEVHTAAELEVALGTPAPLIGINSRDLQTFRTDLGVVERLAPRVPPGRLAVAESGIRGPADVARVRAAGARAVLVGERLMAAPEPAVALRSLLGIPPYGVGPPEPGSGIRAAGPGGPGRVRVKICGVRSAAAARAAVEAGADAVGIIFAPARRQLSPAAAAEVAGAARAGARARGEPVAVVGVFRDAPPETVVRTAEAVGLDVIQLHGSESPLVCQALSQPVVKAIGVASPADLDGARAYAGAVAALLLDAAGSDGYPAGYPGGGAGRSFPWAWAAPERFSPVAPLVLAGGLRPDAVAAALDAVRPYALDVSSGVETGGEKDPAKMAAFVAQARAWRRASAAAGDAGSPAQRARDAGRDGR